MQTRFDPTHPMETGTMQPGNSYTAAKEAHADCSRLHAVQAFGAYVWHVDGATRAGAINPIDPMVTAETSKLRFRWPKESSP